MPSQTRTQKTILNAKVNAICWGVSILIAFFSRKILLRHLGDEFMGLSSMLGSILGYLNITELGVSAVIGVVLYKPLFQGDKNGIKEIVSVFGYIYQKIGLIILTLGVITSFFIPIIFTNTSIDVITIYIGFYAGLISSLLGYFVNYRSVLLTADQRNYEVTGYYQISNTLKSLLQMCLAVYIHSFILFFSIELLFGIIYACILNLRINKIYPWLATEICKGHELLTKYPEITQKVRQKIFHNVGALAQNQTIPIIIYWFISLPMIALYSNYIMIIYHVKGFSIAILNSAGAGIGNLIAECDEDKIYKTYKTIFSIRFFFSALLSMCVYFLISDFIELWLGDEYILSPIVVFILSSHLFLMILRDATDQFLNGYGLFQDVWSPVVESILLISISIFGAYFYALPGLLLGPLLSLILVIYTWKPYFLFSQGFHRPIWDYIWIFAKHLIASAISILVMAAILNYIDCSCISWFAWIQKGILVFMLSCSLLIATFCVVSVEYRNLITNRVSILLRKLLLNH